MRTLIIIFSSSSCLNIKIKKKPSVMIPIASDGNLILKKKHRMQIK